MSNLTPITLDGKTYLVTALSGGRYGTLDGATVEFVTVGYYSTRDKGNGPERFGPYRYAHRGGPKSVGARLTATMIERTNADVEAMLANVRATGHSALVTR